MEDPTPLAEEALELLLSERSPSGSELRLAVAVAEWARERGFRADVDQGPGDSANCVLTLGDGAAGRTLALYAPIDTLDAGMSVHGLLGDPLSPWRSIRRSGGWVAAEGAENPKGYAAAILAAMVQLQRHPVEGTVKALLCGGSMPSLAAPAGVHGLGSGLIRLLQRGAIADAAVSCKPGWSVAHEEVGLLWLRIRVHALGSYVGFRHKAPYSNAVAVAGRLADHLDSWFVRRAVEAAEGLTEPQGAVAAISGGSAHFAAFVSPSCDLHIDMRFAPSERMTAVVRRLASEVEDFMHSEAARWEVEVTASVPASHTNEHDDIILAARTAWEQVEGRPHEHIARTSGASDTSLLRTWGIPTARVGLPLLAPRPAEFLDDPFGMNVVNVDDCGRLARVLTTTAALYCDNRDGWSG